MMAAPLDGAQSRALAGLLAEKAGRFRCPCQDELLAFLVARGGDYHGLLANHLTILRRLGPSGEPEGDEYVLCGGAVGAL